MSDDRTLRFYLEPSLRESAAAGQHNFITKLVQAAGMDAQFLDISERFSGGTGPSLIHMKDPVGPQGLTFRRAYHYPFWQIENTAQRHEFDVAKSAFDPNQIEGKEAQRFYNFWRKRLFDLSGPVSNQGFVYMPLQGRLLEQRSFQTCKPIEMIERCLERFEGRKIIATLHPNEVYSEAELTALEALEAKHATIELRMGQMHEMLMGCACVVTQNSSVAFNAYFYGKPVVLFGQVDFHHIALSGEALPSSEDITNHQPDYAGYVWWFWQDQCINAGRENAQDKIAARLRALGWNI